RGKQMNRFDQFVVKLEQLAQGGFALIGPFLDDRSNLIRVDRASFVIVTVERAQNFLRCRLGDPIGLRLCTHRVTMPKLALSFETKPSSGCEFEVGIKAGDAIWAKAVGKFGVRMLFDISFHLLPVTIIVPNLFAGSTNRQ